MNIAIDSVAVYGYKNRGIGQYAIALIDAMVKASSEDKFFYFNFYGQSHIGKYITSAPNLTEVMIYCGKDSIIARCEKYSELFGFLFSGYLYKNQIDVFLILSPVNSNSVFKNRYRKEWFGNIKVCSVFHDVIPYLDKEKYLSTKTLLRNYEADIDALRFMDQILANSECTKADLCKYFDFASDKVSVIYGSYNQKICRQNFSDEERKKLLDKFGLNKPYILSVLGEDDRKNIDGTIEAFSKLPETISDKYQLAIVCKLSGAAQEKYKRQIYSLGVEGKVILTNFVSDEELVMLHNFAYIACFASKYEGLGLPVLEAYACGLPVVVANNSSLVEVAGDAAFLVDAENSISIAEGIKVALLMSEEERADRQAKADILLEKFSPRNNAIRTLTVIKKVLTNKNDAEDNLLKALPEDNLHSYVRDEKDEAYEEDFRALAEEIANIFVLMQDE